jgi:hypothetical protein
MTFVEVKDRREKDRCTHHGDGGQQHDLQNGARLLSQQRLTRLRQGPTCCTLGTTEVIRVAAGCVARSLQPEPCCALGLELSAASGDCTSLAAVAEAGAVCGVRAVVANAEHAESFVHRMPH